MAFEDFGHQAVNRATNGRDLLEDRVAITVHLEGFFERRRLPLNAPQAREQWFLVLDCMRHIRYYRGV